MYQSKVVHLDLFEPNQPMSKLSGGTNLKMYQVVLKMPKVVSITYRK